MGVLSGQAGRADQFNFIDDFDAGETISEGDAVSLNYTDFQIYKASAANFDHRLNLIGFALEDGTSGNPIKVHVLTVVPTGILSGLTAGVSYFLSDTQGALSSSAGTHERIVGHATASDRLIRRRGPVSNLLSVSASFTAPTDGFIFLANSDETLTVVGQTVTAFESGKTWASLLRMGDSYSDSFSQTNEEHYFQIMDFGSY